MPPRPRQRALVTGASSGIGLELARVLAREGHDLVITARSHETLEAVAHELTREHAAAVHPIAANLAVPGMAEALMAEIAAAGLRVDVLVNNAGLGLYGLFADTPLDDEQRMIQLNVASLVTLTKLCLPAMLQRRGGRILNVASTAAFLPGPRMAVYYATKAFVLSFSEALADELRDTGIAVTALCPGPTRSQFQETARMQRSRLTQGTIMDAATVAEAGYRGLIGGRAVVVPGAANRLVPILVRLLPRRLMTVLSRRAADVS
jgi:short-subunit dehydrogenase